MPGIGRRPRGLTYSPLTPHLRRLFAAGAEADRRGMPVDEVLGEFEERGAAIARTAELRREQGITRRALVERTAAAAVAAAGASLLRTPRAFATTPRIVIVGAGLAGVRCAHMLWTGGSRIASTVYEADTTHIGGRCWSLRGYFANGHVAEHGGAFINQNQSAVRNLATNLGLKQEVVNGGDLLTGEEVFWVNGHLYTLSQATADWNAVGYPVFQSAYQKAPWPQRYNASTAEGRRLDGLNVIQWLDQTGIGSGSNFGQLMQTNVLSEYGGEPSTQSALNLLYLLAWNNQNTLVPLPGDDEKYHIVGGNDQLVSSMVAQLPAGTVKQGQELVAVRDNGDGTTTCTFQSGRKATDVVADHLVLALPFSTLRNVDLSRANLSPLKMQAIQTNGMGQNAKIHVEVSHKTWPALGYSGATYTGPDGNHVAWDDSVPQGAGGGPAVLLCFPGGDKGQFTLTGAAHGKAPMADVNWFLNQVERVFPGTKAAYTGTAYEDHWSLDAWHKGAYSYWKVGQYTAFSGYEQVQERNIHFAGEHTAPEDQGFLNGGVDSGERAATEVQHQV